MRIKSAGVLPGSLLDLLKIFSVIEFAQNKNVFLKFEFLLYCRPLSCNCACTLLRETKVFVVPPWTSHKESYFELNMHFMVAFFGGVFFKYFSP